MKYVTEGLEPSKVLRHFEDINAIPRESGHEEKIAAYLENFARERGLFVVRDGKNNVFIRRESDESRKDEPTVIFQGHTDMVCQKNAGCTHDFSRDGIDMYVDGPYLRARGTTLGGDDGIAVAYMLAILEEKAALPGIECLFTTSEETGMGGIDGFDFSVVRARRMINLDSETEGEAIVSCAGGARCDIVLPGVIVPFGGVLCAVSVRGLYGGHSGSEIDSGRANANKTAARLAYAVCGASDANLVGIDGGTRTNAIPRECEILLAVDDPTAAEKAFEKVVGDIKSELCDADMSAVFTFTKAGGEYKTMWDAESTRRLFSLMLLAPCGVRAMSRTLKGFVEASENLGVVSGRAENGSCAAEVRLKFSTRSPVESMLDMMLDELRAAASLTGGGAVDGSHYSGWDYEKSSPLRDEYTAAFSSLFGKSPRLLPIHAGLECGTVKAAIPDMDIISLGPTMLDIHSPSEHLDIASVGRLWDTLRTMLKF